MIMISEHYCHPNPSFYSFSSFNVQPATRVSSLKPYLFKFLKGSLDWTIDFLAVKGLNEIDVFFNDYLLWYLSPKKLSNLLYFLLFLLIIDSSV